VPVVSAHFRSLYGNGALQAPPGHPAIDGLVNCRRPPSSRTRRNQYDATGVLACARRRNDVTRCKGTDTYPCANTTSSVNGEVYTTVIVSQRRQSRIGPRNVHKTIAEDRTYSSGDMFAGRQLENRLTHYLMLIFYVIRNVRRILVRRGVNAPLMPEAKKIWKI